MTRIDVTKVRVKAAIRYPEKLEMSERVTAEELRRAIIYAEEYSSTLADILNRAADTIAALEREAKPVKFRWIGVNCYAGLIYVGHIQEFRGVYEVLIGPAGEAQLVTTKSTRFAACTALEAEVLKRLRGGECPTHRHVKTGGLYEVLHDRATIEADMSEAVIYRSHDGRVWIRPRDEFHDGRFEQLRGGE